MNYSARTIIAVSTAHLLLHGCSGTTEPKRPNILFIMSDDHAYQAISSYGHGLIQTPNIDRIANEGVRFNNCFVTNSLCGPSRAVILTGKYSNKNGFYDNGNVFDGEQQTMPKLFKAAGYQTAIFGKWHLKSTPTGFDYYSIHYGQGEYYNPDFMENGEVRKHYEGYATDLTTTNMIRFLESADKKKPFFVMMHYKAPHRNWMPASEKLTMFESDYFPFPETFYDTYEGRNAARQQEMSVGENLTLGSDLKTVGQWDTIPPVELARMTKDQRIAWDSVYSPLTRDFSSKMPVGKALIEWKFQRYMRDYLKCVASIDDNVGRILKYLEKTGQIENTIIVYTSDQGFYLGEHGWFDKRFIYEESLRTPFMIRYPKIVPEKLKISDAMIQNLDFAPTLLEMAGLDFPGDMQGESFIDVLTGKKQSFKSSIYYHYYEYPGGHSVKRHYGIRTERYKLIHFYDDIDEWELFDLRTDPNEMKNLIEDPEMAVTVEMLKQELNKLQVKYR